MAEDKEIKWYMDDKGNVSAMRLIVVPSVYLGMLVIICGVVAMFMGNPDAVAAMGVGAGLVATAEASKAWQKGKEGVDEI